MATLKCGWCGTTTHMTVRWNTWRGPHLDDQEKSVVSSAFSCDRCHRLSVASIVLDEGFGIPAEVGGAQSFWLNRVNMEWAPRYVEGQNITDVPVHIAAAASEAHKSASIGNRMSAILMARTVIEATAKDKGITKGMLQAKIEAMLKAGLVRQHIKESADEIRHFGNDMAHGDITDPVDDDDVNEVLALMNEVLNEVYQSHARLAKVRDKRLAKKAAGTP